MSLREEFIQAVSSDCRGEERTTAHKAGSPNIHPTDCFIKQANLPHKAMAVEHTSNKNCLKHKQLCQDSSTSNSIKSFLVLFLLVLKIQTQKKGILWMPPNAKPNRVEQQYVYVAVCLIWSNMCKWDLLCTIIIPHQAYTVYTN